MNTPFRIRHLQSVSVSNLNVNLEHLSRGLIYFALSTMAEDNLGYFYKSCNCDNILNPYWECLDLSYENIKRFSFLDSFVISFFIHQNDKNKLIAEIRVNISGLLPFHTSDEQTEVVLRKRIKNDGNLSDTSCSSKQDGIICLFQFNNILYSFDFNNPKIQSCIDSPRKAKTTKTLYNKSTIKKFMFLLSDDYQQQNRFLIFDRQNIGLQVYDCTEKMHFMMVRRNNIIKIESQIQLAKKIGDTKQKKLFQSRLSIVLLKEKIDSVLVNSEKIEYDISKYKKLLRGSKEIYIKISNGYLLRMYRMIHELTQIFPISLTGVTRKSIQKSHSSSSFDSQIKAGSMRSTDRLSIVNLYLPISDKQNLFIQDVSTFAALGMVFQLLNALSGIYDIPLRYPMISIFDKTMIRDNIINIDDNARNFVLIKSSSENFRLQYGIHLLNLNIIAIRSYFGLSTKHLDHTLWNLSTLIEGKNRVLRSNDGESTQSTIEPGNNSPILDTRTSSVNNPLYMSCKSSPLLTKNRSVFN